MIGIRLVTVVINLIALQTYISLCYGKDSYAKDLPIAKAEKCKLILIVVKLSPLA